MTSASVELEVSGDAIHWMIMIGNDVVVMSRTLQPSDLTVLHFNASRAYIYTCIYYATLIPIVYVFIVTQSCTSASQ